MRTAKRTWIARALVGALLLGAVTATASDIGWWNGYISEESTLPADVQAVMLEALLASDGEYAAYATYAAIIEAYGDVNPFVNIMASEAKHIDALKTILDRYDVPYPTENPYLGEIDLPGSLAEAAQAGVDAEIANVALYERQLSTASSYPDIVEVFVSLQTASQENHLPAFERAVARYARAWRTTPSDQKHDRQ
jgi:hypothetical protein